jgi:hypothetical protein
VQLTNFSINHLGTDLFAYQCDKRCKDWLYEVRGWRHSFCNDCAAAIAELIWRRVGPREARLEKVLHGLVDEFVDILCQESLLQERHTELKDDVMRFLELER